VTARAAAILPVRFASTRLPGKPLLEQTGWPLVRHVWEQVRRARRLDPVIVATDDERIAAAVARFGGRVEMTSPGHPSGSDRVAEVAARLDAPLILNVQGDEPEIDPGDLDRLVERLASGGEELVTLARRLAPSEQATLADPNVVKVVLDGRGRALYFSRCPVPHGARPEDALAHQGVYGWRREALAAFAAAPPCEAERLERLEQLRALHMGMRVGVVLTTHASLGIDTPSDYAAFVERCAARAAARGGGSA
jgi:3-deoxy-manno-octulosonate cytidylyltransferase (CMP-KDO synthetase)